MKVKDLMVKLSLLDPNMDVMVDKTREDAEMFKFESLLSVDEVETEDGSKFIGLFGKEYEEEKHNLN